MRTTSITGRSTMTDSWIRILASLSSSSIVYSARWRAPFRYSTRADTTAHCGVLATCSVLPAHKLRGDITICSMRGLSPAKPLQWRQSSYENVLYARMTYAIWQQEEAPWYTAIFGKMRQFYSAHL